MRSRSCSRLWDSWEDDAVIRDQPTGRYIDREQGALHRLRRSVLQRSGPVDHAALPAGPTADLRRRARRAVANARGNAAPMSSSSTRPSRSPTQPRCSSSGRSSAATRARSLATSPRPPPTASSSSPTRPRPSRGSRPRWRRSLDIHSDGRDAARPLRTRRAPRTGTRREADPPGRALPRREQHDGVERSTSRAARPTSRRSCTSPRPRSVGKFDFFFLAEGLRLREHRGRIFDLDVVGRPDSLTVLAALAAVTDRIGLAATLNTTFNEPFELARQFATLDHLSNGRAAWNAVTSPDAFTGENFRRAGFLPRDDRYERAARVHRGRPRAVGLARSPVRARRRRSSRSRARSTRRRVRRATR